LLLRTHRMRQLDFTSTPEYGTRQLSALTPCAWSHIRSPTLQTAFIPLDHNKTKLYRLHNPDLTGWQGGLQMMKNETDSVGMARESGGADSAANPPLQAKQSLARGDRVQMSALGRARHPKYGDRQGLIVGRGSPSSWRVKFDERSYVQAIHCEYLEKVERSAPFLS
jgi:hypothetical protein